MSNKPEQDLPPPGPPFEVGERIAFGPLVFGPTKPWLDWGEAVITRVESGSESLRFHLESDPEGQITSQGMEVTARVTASYRAWRVEWQRVYETTGSENDADHETRDLFLRVVAEHPIHGPDVVKWQRGGGQPHDEDYLSHNEKHKLTERYRAALDRVSAVLFAADPIGVAEANPNADEYEPEAQRILARSQKASGPADLSRITRDVFVEQFSEADAGPASRYDDIATEIWPIVQALRGS